MIHVARISTSIYVTYTCYCKNNTLPSIVPDPPNVMNPITTATSISLFWSISMESVVTSYNVLWQSDECTDEDNGNATTINTSYIIQTLRGGAGYTITVTATNSAGTTPSDSVTGETDEMSR